MSEQPNNELNVTNPTVHHTHNSKVVEGMVSVSDLKNLKSVIRPRKPWSEEEDRRRWKKSCETGHLQLFFKCQVCSLEFVLLTLRTDVEAMEAYQPSHGQHGGFCAKITCPECGRKGMSVLLHCRNEQLTIFEFVTKE